MKAISPGDPVGQDRFIAEAIERERPRLRAWLRRHLPDAAEVEDVLQEAFYELVLATRLMRPVEHAGGWLFRIAMNRVVDLVRRRRPEAAGGLVARGQDDGRGGEPGTSRSASPEEAAARSAVIEELEAAVADLPAPERAVFLAHEIDGKSFQEIARETGVNVNTLLSRKHRAVLALRRRLRAAYDELFNPNEQEEES